MKFQYIFVVIVIGLFLFGCTSLKEDTKINDTQENQELNNQLTQTFEEEDIKFAYSNDLEVHLGGITGNSDTIVNLIPPHKKSTISVQKVFSQVDSIDYPFCETLNDAATNYFEISKLGSLQACKYDYNADYNGVQLHCLQYITVFKSMAYSVNYCMGKTPCDQHKDVNLAGVIQKECEITTLGDAFLFKTDINYFLKEIVNSFEITE